MRVEGLEFRVLCPRPKFNLGRKSTLLGFRGIYQGAKILKKSEEGPRLAVESMALRTHSLARRCQGGLGFRV